MNVNCNDPLVGKQQLIADGLKSHLNLLAGNKKAVYLISYGINVDWFQVPNAVLIKTLFEGSEAVMKKKVNPRRTPLPRNALNKDAIIEEAMKDDMAHAWLLVAGPLLDRGYELPPLADAVSAYVNRNTGKPDKKGMLRVDATLGYKRPNLDISRMKSPVELAAFKKKVWRIAMQTSLCIVYLALEEGIDKAELKEIFFSADLTLAEVESGINSFDEIQRELLERVGSVGLIEETGE